MNWLGGGVQQLGDLGDERETRRTVVVGIGAIQGGGNRGVASIEGASSQQPAKQEGKKQSEGDENR